MNHKNRYFLAGILFLSFILRCLCINTRSIWYDDAFTILLAERSLPEIVAGTAADTMPPLFYFLMHFWTMLGRELWWLRMLSVLISLGSILFLYFLVTELFEDAKAGLWAAFLTGIAPIQVFHAQGIRMYALLAFCQLAYMYFFVRIWRGDQEKFSWGNWGAFIIFGIGAMYTHNLAIFMLAVPTVFLFFRREWKLMWKLLFGQFVIGLFTLPWLIMIPSQIEKIQTAFWTPRPGLVEVMQSIVMFNATLPLPGIWFVVAVVLSLQILSLLVFEVLRRREKQVELTILAVWALLPPLMMFVVSYFMRPIFVTRGFLASSFAYYAIAGWVISRSWSQKIGMVLVGGFAAASLISLPYQLTFNQFPRSPFQEATAYLEEAAELDSLVVHDNKLSLFPSYYFAPDLPQVFLGDEPGSHNDTLAYASQAAMNLYPEQDIQSAASGVDHIYFVVFEKTIDEYRTMGESDHPNLLWLEEHYQNVGREIFEDLLVYEYVR